MTAGLHFRRPAPAMAPAEFRARLAALLGRLEASDGGRALAAVVTYGLRAARGGSGGR
jgi:hypothetical protein